MILWHINHFRCLQWSECVFVLGSGWHADISKPSLTRQSQTLWRGTEEECRRADIGTIYSHTLSDMLMICGVYTGFYFCVLGCTRPIPAHWARPKEPERGSGDEEPADTRPGEEDLPPGESGKL